MTSNTVGSSWPPYFFGQLRPKNPASYNAVCHSPWRAQYSSSVDGGSWIVLVASQVRKRARNSASSGESRKSTGRPDPVVPDPLELLAVVAEPQRREQRAAQVDVGDALPRVADAAVHLDRGLAHGA